MDGPMNEPGLALWVNGTPCQLRALRLTDGPDVMPLWEADVDGALGLAGSLETALLEAARNATRHGSDDVPD
jgi:hypothetical protein